MKRLLIVSFVLISIGLTAQKKIIFSSQNYAALLEGEHGSQFQLETINGIKYRTWFTGLGTGIDWYYRRSIPLFLSFGKDLLKRGNRNFFITANGGIDFPWGKNDYQNEWGYQVQKVLPGVYWEGGLGYKIGIGKCNDALLMQLGYSYKYVGEKIAYSLVPFTDPDLPGPLRGSSADRFNYHLRRLSLKLGWNF